MAKVRLRRLGNRLLCPSCFNAIKTAPSGPAPAAEDLQDLLRRTVLVTFTAIAAKTVLYVPLFLWARHSDMGAGALRGTVAADVFTWMAFSVVEWQSRRFQVTAGGCFELILVILYLNREPLFDISGNIETVALSVLFFFTVMFAKTGLWLAERVLEVTGVKETALP